MSDEKKPKTVIGAFGAAISAANKPNPVKQDVVDTVIASIPAIAKDVVASSGNPITSQYHAEKVLESVLNKGTLTQDPLLGSKRVALAVIAGLTAAIELYSGDWKAAAVAGLLAGLGAWSKLSDGRPVG